MRKSLSIVTGLIIVSVILLSCKSKKTGCDAYGENGTAKKNTERAR